MRIYVQVHKNCIKEIGHVVRALGFPGGSDHKESACNWETQGQSLGWKDPLEKGMGHPLQYSCLENSMDRGAWWATVHGVTKSQR